MYVYRYVYDSNEKDEVDMSCIFVGIYNFNVFQLYDNMNSFLHCLI